MATIQVRRQFAEDFSLVAMHYRCSAGEVQEMKACAREHLEQAQPCFADLASEIRRGALQAERPLRRRGRLIG